MTFFAASATFLDTPEFIIGYTTFAVLLIVVIAMLHDKSE